MSTTIQQNNTNLQSILDSVNALEPNTGGDVPNIGFVEVWDENTIGIKSITYTTIDTNKKIITKTLTDLTDTDYEDGIGVFEAICGSVIYIESAYVPNDYWSVGGCTLLFSYVDDTGSNISLAILTNDDPEYVSGISAKHLIMFSISDTMCIAEEGMTWEEWVESSYNVDGWFINSSMDVVLEAHESSAVYHTFESGNYVTVKANELIVAEKVYIQGSY